MVKKNFFLNISSSFYSADTRFWTYTYMQISAFSPVFDTQSGGKGYIISLRIMLEEAGTH